MVAAQAAPVALCFHVVVMMLATCNGSTLPAATEAILDNASFIWRKSDTLSQSTNFYLELLLTQTAAHSGLLVRG